jgi:hypothetical protein
MTELYCFTSTSNTNGEHGTRPFLLEIYMMNYKKGQKQKRCMKRRKGGKEVLDDVHSL